MSETTMTVKQARALVKIAPKADVRYCLNGVLIDFENARAVVTDGHKLVAFNLDNCHPTDGADSVILGLDDLAGVARGGKQTDEIIIIGDGDTAVRFVRNGTETKCKGIDARYPDYSRVLPDKITGIFAQYNPEYLNQIQDCLRALVDMPDGYGHFQPNGAKDPQKGGGAGVMTIPGYEDQAIGVVMPYRPADSFDVTANPIPDFLSAGGQKKVA